MPSLKVFFDRFWVGGVFLWCSTWLAEQTFVVTYYAP